MVIGLTLVMVIFPAAAAAHQQLLSAAPAEGDTLLRVPTEIRLTFNQSVEPSLASLRLVGPSGEVALAPATVPGNSPTLLLASIAGPLTAGSYTVHWLVTGDDGHPVRGEVDFTIAADAEGLAPPVPAAGPGEPAEPSISGSQVSAAQGDTPGLGRESDFGPGSPLYVAARWLTFLGIVIVVGAVAFALLLLPAMRRRGGAPPSELLANAASRAATLGLFSTGALLAGAGLRLVSQMQALQGAGGGSSGELVLVVLTRSVWGWGWMLQAAAALLAIVGFALARSQRRSGWNIAAVAAVAIAITPALSGHAAATSPLAVFADFLHVLAAGAWLGTLLVMVVAGIPLLLERPTARRADAASLLGAFSAIGLTCAAVVTATGIYAAWLHLPEVADLWSTPYGRTLLLKLSALTVVFGTGAYNWRRAGPALAERQDAGPLRRSASAELAMGALVLAITAALVATPPPAETSAARQEPTRSSSAFTFPN